MTLDAFWELARTVGLPFALVLTALLAGRAGIWVWGREVDYERKQFTERLQDQAQRAGEREAELLQRETYWRDKFWDVLDKTERAVSVGEKVADLADRRGGRKP